MVIRKSVLLSAGYLYLALPVFLFFGGFLKLYYGFPFCAVLALALYCTFKINAYQKNEIDDCTKMSLKICLGSLAILALWVFASGQGGYYYQSMDHHWRNAIFHDLITYHWPVIYPKTDSALAYYIAHWLPAALVGKLFGWEAANLALYLWTLIGIVIVYLLLYAYFKIDTKYKACALLLIFILFSGLDFIGTMLKIILTGAPFPFHLEWWAYPLQYSSNTTQLMWVYNQAVAPWIATAVLLHEKKCSNIVFLALLILPSAPFPFVGFVVIAAVFCLKRLLTVYRLENIQAALRELFSPQNTAALLSIFPVFYLYYFGNNQVAGTGFGEMFGGESYFLILPLLIIFCYLEFIVYSVIIYPNFKNDYLFITINIILLFAPLFKLGESSDFVMRVSIPPLFMLMVYTLKYIFESLRKGRVLTAQLFVLIIVLSIGAITPFVEQCRALKEIVAAQKINLVADDIKTFGDKKESYENFLTSNYEDKLFYKLIGKN